jgi:hypothetical protein
MRTIVCLILGCVLSSLTASGAAWDQEYGRLLKKYVTPSGVRYGAWKANADDVAALGKVVEQIGNDKVPANSKEALAFYTNAYNAWILNEALEKYPTKSVKDTLFTFFTGERIKVAGQPMSFNRLEKDIILKRFKEPRIHMALNCASRSCPPLRNEPFTAAALDAQLEDQSRDFSNSPRGVTAAKGGYAVSKIFDWYKEDFAPVGGAPGFLSKYRKEPIPANAKISFQEYDWALNEAK